MPSQRAPANEQLLIPPAYPSGSDSPQMLGREQKRNDAQARQEEARLLGARDYKDKDAVPITPGATLGRRKIPGTLGAFKPTDRISQNSRESGPVRASGKSKSSDSYLSRNRPQLDEALDFEESSRPSKRRRQDASGKPLDLMDEGAAKSGSSAGTYPAAKRKSNGWNARQHDEFRGVEDSIKVDRSPRATRRAQHTADSHDEQFTAMATQQRHSLSNTKERHRQEVLEDIETPKGKSISTEKARDEPQSDSQKRASSTRARRVSEGRDSPDELQGEATTQPVPKFLAEMYEQAHRHPKENRISQARKRSPSDIQPTDFVGSAHHGSKKAKRSHKSSGISFLEVLFVGFGSVNKRVAEGESAAIRLGKDKLELEEDITGPGKKTEILLRHVRMAWQGMEPSRKVRLVLSRPSDAQDPNNIDIEFSTVLDKSKLVRILQDMQTKVLNKEDSYMEKSFANSEREWAQRGTHTKRPLLDTSAVEPDLPTPAHSVARQKLSSALKDATGESSESRPDKVKNGAQGKTDGANESREVASGRKEESDAGVEIPVKPFRPTDPGRESRSTRRTTRVSEKSTARDDGASGFERQPSPENDAARKKWTKPLVYPRAEKKKAEVSVEDRDRLRADEFLNDNLIGFYMRFLQDHLERTNKQAAQRVYFFNSYFFDTLTKTPKGERGINYSGVEKWTRSVDLFSYDYIVVPINQNAHWYVAIICNLPSLELGSADPVEPSSAAVSDKETSNQPESEVQEILESPELEASLTSAAPAEVDAEKEPKREAESPASQAARQSLATMSLGEAGQAQVQGEKPMEPAQTDEWPDEDENPPITPTKFPKVRQRPPETQEQSANAPQQGRKTKKKGKAGPKLSPGQTTVITFDSLDLARSPTIRMLREYICKEAASKRGVEVDPTAIKGMRARQIPLQPNYSDCGLYLLAYVEKFVQDPDQFITKLLRREMDEKDDWPPLGSGLLRHRLRNFLDDLYEEQAKLKKDKSERKPIMADQQPVSFLLGPAQPSKDDGGGKEAVGGRSESANFSKSANAVEKPAAEKNTAQRREDGEPSDGPAADQPQLVPLETVPTSKPSKEKVPSEPLPAATASAKDSALPKEQEIIEVPDSQEKGHATITATQPGPKLIRTEKSAGKDEEACSKKPERKKAAIPAGSDIVHVDESVLKDETQVEVQVRQTPPPSEPQRVPKSP